MKIAPLLPDPIQRILVALLLLTMWAGGTWFKAHQIFSHPEFSHRDDTAMFWGEDAFRYRYAKMFAEGIAPAQPDKGVFWPQGISVRDQDSLIAEKLAGNVFRTFVGSKSSPPFHVFLVWWISGIAALGVWPVYCLSRSIWRHRLAGVASALLWVTACAGLAPSSMLRLDSDATALPWMLMALHFVLSAVSKDPMRRIARGLLAAGFCWCALTISPTVLWFFFVVLVIAAAIDYRHLIADMLTEREPLATPRTIQGRAIYGPAMLVGLAIVGAGFAVPSLRARGVGWSLPVIFGGTWILLGYLLRRLRLPQRWRPVDDAAKLMPRAFRWRRILIPCTLWLLAFGTLVTVAVLTRWLTHTKMADYQPVLTLIVEKLCRAGQLPLAAHHLRDEVRWLWTHEFPGADATTLWLSALGLFVVMPFAIRLPFLQVRHMAGAAALSSGARLVLPFGRAVIVSTTVALTILWVLASRLDGWFAAVAAVVAGAVVDLAMNVPRYPPLWRLGSRPKVFAAMLLTFALILNLLGMQNLLKHEQVPPRSQLLTLIKQIRKSTEPNSAIAAPLALNGPIAAATGRPVALDADVFIPPHRQRVQEFGNALFGSEANLAELCQKLSIEYLVVGTETMLNLGPGSWRYDSNHLMASAQSAAYRMHFEPATLRQFQLIYTGPFYRLYRVRSDQQERQTPEAITSYPLWVRRNFSDDRIWLLPEMKQKQPQMRR